MDEFDTIVEIISEFLGEPKKVYENTSQVSWNCPVCDEGGNKGNLEVNIEKIATWNFLFVLIPKLNK